MKIDKETQLIIEVVRKQLEIQSDLPKQKDKGKKWSFSKKIVTLVILLNTVFAIAVLYIFAISGVEPMALIGAWFAFTTVELWQLASIKRTEVEEETDECEDFEGGQ